MAQIRESEKSLAAGEPTTSLAEIQAQLEARRCDATPLCEAPSSGRKLRRQMPLVSPPSHPDRFDAVRDALADLDAAQLAAAAGALTLLPSNGHRPWRLGALATLAAERPGGGAAVSASRLRAAVNAGDLAAVAAQQDDPFDDVLAEEMVFHGGSYLVGPGLAENSVCVLQLVMRGLLQLEALPAPLRAELSRLCSAALRLSDHVLRVGGLMRNQEPVIRHTREMEVPSQARLRALMSLCTFEDRDLYEIGVESAVLQPLVLTAAARHFEESQILGGFADQWPLVRFDDKLVLARPFDLVVALRHHMLLRAVDVAGEDLVACVFAEAVQSDVLASLQRMGVGAQVTKARAAEQPWIEVEAEIDNGLLLASMIVPDSMQGLSSDPYGTFDTAHLPVAVHARLEERAAGFDGQVLGLLVFQPAGRGVFMGLNEPEATNLTLEQITGADLDVFAFLEQGEPLALWKFAQAQTRLRTEALVRAFSALDVYAVFLEHERSLAPLREATMVMAAPGGSGELRRRAKRERDRHGALYVDGTVREVEREPDEGFGESLYYLSEVVEVRLMRHVGGAPVDIWICGPEGKEAAQESWDLVETAAYWMSELVEPLHDRLRALAEHTLCMRIDIGVADRAAWFGGGSGLDGGPSDRIEVDGRAVQLILSTAVRSAAPQPDNEGDRILVAALLEAFDALAQSFGLEPLGEGERSAIVEQVAPPGVKKHLIMFPIEANPLMAPANSRPREVQQADLTAARELVGAHLMERFGLEVGPVPNEQRRVVVREAVEFLLARVQEVLDNTAHEGLLEDLLANNEQLIADSENKRALLPARAATYPDAVDRQRLREQLAGSAQATVCCRFLAEYVAACPPTGRELWGTSRYDRAMALAAVMLDWAYMDDALHHGMSDVGLMINSDHHLRLQELDRYEQGKSEYFDVHIDDQRQKAERIFPLRFKAPEEASPSEVRARIDPLMAEEAGASLTELGGLLHAAARRARAAEIDVMVTSRDAAIAVLAKDLDWSPAKVEKAVAYLSMGPRDKFLKPPSGSWQDVVPSRFARRFSLNRRPFLVRSDELLWGQRQPLAALLVIVGQLFSGRYQRLAETPALEAELSRLAVKAGHAFERDVAEVFDTSSRFMVRAGLASVGGVAVKRDNGEDLGDFDVLAADTDARVLYAVECKDLAGALTPSEVAGELSEHFDSDEGLTTYKHAERVAWLGAHRAQALAELRLEGPPTGWQVKGMFVTGHHVMAPYIRDVRFPIVAIDDLPGWIRALPKRSSRRNRRRNARRK